MNDISPLPYKSYSLRSRILIFSLNLLTLTIIDQLSKLWAYHSLRGKLAQSYFMGLFQLRYAENSGAWGNLGGQWPEPLRSIFLIGMPILVLLLVALFIFKQQNAHKLETWAYTLIVVGGFGNLIDRIRLNYVIDFLYMGTHRSLDLFGIIRIPLETNIFNIADMVIMTGAGLIMLNFIREKLRT